MLRRPLACAPARPKPAPRLGPRLASHPSARKCGVYRGPRLAPDRLSGRSSWWDDRLRNSRRWSKEWRAFAAADRRVARHAPGRRLARQLSLRI